MFQQPTSLQILSTPDELPPLRGGWDRLAARFSTPLLTHDWFLAAAAALHAGDPLAVFIRRSGVEPVAIAPLVRRRRHGRTVLEFIGSEVLCEPSGILYARPADLRDVLRDVFAQGLPVRLDRVGDPILAAELSAIEGGTAASLHKSLSVSPWIRVDEPWVDFYGGISSRWRSARRRAMRKAEAGGDVRFEFASPDEREVGRLLDRFSGVEGRSWKGRLGTSIGESDGLARFFGLYGRAAARRGVLRTAFLEIGGTPAAGQIAVDHAGTRWLLKIGHDERFDHCSPGILLMHAALERAFADGVRRFEFLGNDEEWLRIWPRRLRRYYTRSVDSDPARRLLSRALELGGRMREGLRTRLARASGRG